MLLIGNIFPFKHVKSKLRSSVAMLIGLDTDRRLHLISSWRCVHIVIRLCLSVSAPRLDRTKRCLVSRFVIACQYNSI